MTLVTVKATHLQYQGAQACRRWHQNVQRNVAHDNVSDLLQDFEVELHELVEVQSGFESYLEEYPSPNWEKHHL